MATGKSKRAETGPGGAQGSGSLLCLCLIIPVSSETQDRTEPSQKHSPSAGGDTGQPDQGELGYGSKDGQTLS